MASEETDRAMLEAAGFPDVELFKRIDADVCIGRDIDEAIDYQLLVGPSGEIIREAGDLGQQTEGLVAPGLRQPETVVAEFVGLCCRLVSGVQLPFQLPCHALR